jgi:hypothetical protein
MIGHVLWQMFSWPGGNVIGNMVASAICSVLVYLKLHLKMNAQHREKLEQAERHHRENLSALRE